MKFTIIFLSILLFSQQRIDVQGQDLDDSSNIFRDLFRQGLQSLTRLCNRRNGRNNGQNNNQNEDNNQNDDNNNQNNDKNDNDSNLAVSNFNNFCNCRLGSNVKIVNGQITKKNSIPWFSSLATRISGRHFCGASIINENHLLTAVSVKIK